MKKLLKTVLDKNVFVVCHIGKTYLTDIILFDRDEWEKEKENKSKTWIPPVG